MKQLDFLLILIVLQLKILNEVLGKGTVLPKQARVVQAGSIKLKLDTEMLYNICEVTTSKNKTFTYDKNYPDNSILTLDPNCDDQILWLGYECGIILSSASNCSSGIWTFKAITNTETYQDRSTISIILKPILETEVLVSLGSLAIIDCNKGNPDTKPTYCTIINNFGDIVTENCDYVIPTVSLNNFGNWICKIAIMGAMEEFEHTVILKKKDDEYLKSEALINNNTLVLSCTLMNSNFHTSWCRAVNPNGEKLLLTQGIVTERYSAFETNIAQRKCSIGIQLPLLEKEIGRWRLELGQSMNDFTGCFITTPTKKKFVWKRFVTPKQENINVIVGESMVIKCSVPWPISYCYAKMPNKTNIYASGFPAERIQRVGFCSVRIPKITYDLAGIWICGVSSYDGSADTLFNKNVNVINDKIYTENNSVEVNLGMDIQLMCKSPINEAMRYCRFISPSGESILLQPVKNLINARISYWGSDINKGQCGVHIKNIEKKDIGIWICATSFSVIGEEYFGEIIVDYKRISVAFTIGMSIGGLLIFVILVGFLIKVYRKHKISNMRNDHHSPSISSELLSTTQDIHMYSFNSPIHRRHVDINN